MYIYNSKKVMHLQYKKRGVKLLAMIINNKNKIWKMIF